MDEQSLLKKVRAGDAVAERELYDTHVDRVFRLAYRMSGDETIAQDITQDTFVRAFSRLDGFRGDAAFATWLYAIAHSVALNTLRKVRRLRNRETDLEETRNTAVTSFEVEPDLAQRLRQAINELSEKHRTVFLMHDVEGFKHHEIAQAMGTRVGTSKSHLARARAQLRGALSAFAQEWVS